MNERPVGTSPGVGGLVLAWFGGVAVVRLTGATPVVLVLAAGVVLGLAAVFSGWWTVRRCHIRGLRLPATATAGADVPVDVTLVVPKRARPVWLELRVRDERIAAGWSTGEVTPLTARFTRRGAVADVEVLMRSAGAVGALWWRKRLTVDADVVVAPVALRGTVRIDRSTGHDEGDRLGRAGSVSGETDGVRPWREGDSERSVHWSSTLRSGELVVHDHRQAVDRSSVVRATSFTGDPDSEAAAARWALDDVVRSGDRAFVAVDDGPAVPIADRAAVERWSALADLGAPNVSEPRRGLVDRLRRDPERVEPESTARVAARYWAGAATLVSLVMLTNALAYSSAITVAVIVGVVAGTVASSRTIVTGDPAPIWVRTLVGLGALLALAMVFASIGQIDGLFAILRGPLPQLLLVLIVLHGFESRDRRTVRVGMGISSVVLMYASAFRVDGTIAWWLIVWGICFWCSMSRLGAPTRPVNSPRVNRAAGSSIRSAAWVSVSALAMFALLIVVPVPAGPARLTLPTLITDSRPIAAPGAVVGPDGTVRDAADGSGEPSRAPAGQPGGYNGFADSMDTSVRGSLGDDVVMRVRAPAADFWRGQTFSTFDGRTWFADQETGTLRDGPQIDIPPAFGDVGERFIGDAAVDYEDFVQTYYIEADMPNVIFGAYRPSEVIVDASVWTRADGAIRASTVFLAESVYTVVSRRPIVTADQLRQQGDIGERLSSRGAEAFDRYLTVPATTTQRTRDLAQQLAVGHSTTYDVVRAYERWIGANVEYDLSAPLPAPGADAVDDFLFNTQLGFCEQIASALTIMLRTQGVPARLATGYAAGERDRIAGVYEVRASDAHAWVEVWFPESGWQAFDPTASVPLSADSGVSSVGADLIAGVSAYVSAERELVLAVLASGASIVVAVLLIGELRRRRQRGRWGLLQDRFADLAVRRGGRSGAPNPQLASVWTDADDAAVARDVAARLDRAAFDPTFHDDGSTDEWYRTTAKLVGSLRTTRR
ncbi:MAG TPA: transglutaminaseTgpA domain-containing protein [Ilumatobacter sp.]|nr:transglutaminaseTgpA domain-containing protein [Ilumatobacter sp.]